MPQPYEGMFYELMWRAHTRGDPWPTPWWVQQYFRSWVDFYDGGLFSSKEASFAANAYYRYWNMVGVKNNHQESLVGQAGEVEPVYDQYTLHFFLFDPATKTFFFPQMPEAINQHSPLIQTWDNGPVPIIQTIYQTPSDIEVTERVFSTTIGQRQRSVTLVRFSAHSTSAAPKLVWLCLAITPPGPSGFQRHNQTGHYIADGRITFMQYLQADQRVLVNSLWGPIFDTTPMHFGVYGNPGSENPEDYLKASPYQDLLMNRGVDEGLNGQTIARDFVAGLCTGVFAWEMNLTQAQPTFTLDVRLPVDDYHDTTDLVELRADSPDALEQKNQQFWTEKLGSGLQIRLPPTVAHLNDLYSICRANLLMLSDEGEIHPGPTIYDSFWIRDSSVEGVACALAGDQNLAAQQFGYHYPGVFTYGNGQTDPKLTWGPASLHGFFGGDHEKNDYEWDSNGQALWAIGRFDRISGANKRFGESLFSPYVYEGALWLRDNRSSYGLLPSGWSAEHLGEKDKPHYWDDFWGLAGLWEAGQLANRIGAPQASEIWAAYDTFQRAIGDSIRWVLGEQRKQGHWETFIPTGPADVGRLDSTIVGAVAYFHPCRLYMGAKLGADIDWAARQTLETIWSHFIQGGFRHDASWHCYGSYLTLQLAHAFLFTGQLEKMEQCLTWAVLASSVKVSRTSSWPADKWQVVLKAWNEQHAYPIASDFGEVPGVPWYMGDMPHGWTCAELMLLLRDILFFEADEDGHPHMYLAPGVLPHWIGDNEFIEVIDAPTVFGSLFGYRLTHQQATSTLIIDITQPLPALTNVSFVYTCQFGRNVQAVQVNGVDQPLQGNQILLPANTQQAIITYQQ